MKKPKTTKRTVTARKPTAHRSVRARSTKRHVRIGLHPISVMVQLCVGVLLVMSTITAFGDNYSVHATVPADPLTDPAVITSPNDGDHMVVPALDITGTCPVPSYIELRDNGNLIGVTNCVLGNFQFSILLSAGSNQLLVQDYNVTDAAGPASTSITVTYDAPIPPTPPTGGGTGGSSNGNGGSNGNNVVPPVTLQIMQVDNNVPYSPQTVPLTTQQPVFTGIATPYSAITLVLHSNPIVCKTTANANGYWRCAITDILPIGVHSVDVTAVSPSGTVIKTPQFHIQAIDEVPASTQQTSSGGAFLISTNYHYQVAQVGQSAQITVVINGGISPYALTINWGDGNTSTLLRASDDSSTITHTYKWFDAPIRSYSVKIQATDSTGHVSSSQQMTVIRNPNYVNPASTVGHYSGLLGLIIAIRAWLWLLWPAYIIIILMLISFWLGERKQLDNDKTRPRRMRSTTKPHKRHA